MIGGLHVWKEGLMAVIHVMWIEGGEGWGAWRTWHILEKAISEAAKAKTRELFSNMCEGREDGKHRRSVG